MRRNLLRALKRFRRFFFQLAPKINTGMDFPNHYLMTASQEIPLDLHFKHSWTELGLCFTFNMMDNIYVYRENM